MSSKQPQPPGTIPPSGIQVYQPPLKGEEPVAGANPLLYEGDTTVR